MSKGGWGTLEQEARNGWVEGVEKELSAQERAVVVASYLCHGAHLSTKDVCALTGLTSSGARRLLYKIARVWPIRRDEEGRWEEVYGRLFDETLPHWRAEFA